MSELNIATVNFGFINSLRCVILITQLAIGISQSPLDFGSMNSLRGWIYIELSFIILPLFFGMEARNLAASPTEPLGKNIHLHWSDIAQVEAMPR